MIQYFVNKNRRETSGGMNEASLILFFSVLFSVCFSCFSCHFFSDFFLSFKKNSPDSNCLSTWKTIIQQGQNYALP